MARRGLVCPVARFPQAIGLLVLTNDDWNTANTIAVGGAVRLTTSERRGGPGSPQLSTGAKAVCVFPKFLSTRMVRTEPRARPTPGRLSLADMRLVALAIADAYELRPTTR